MLKGGYTCVILKDDIVLTFTERGIKPLLSLYESGEDVKGFCAADKVVGRGAAFLYLMLEVSEVYADVLSRPALEVLKQNKVAVTYNTLTDNIINRAGDGICPFEEAVLGVTEKSAAYTAIKQKMAKMQ